MLSLLLWGLLGVAAGILPRIEENKLDRVLVAMVLVYFVLGVWLWAQWAL